MTDEYTRAVLKKVVAQICQTIGWHSIHTTPLEVMVDVLHRFIQKVSRSAVNYSHEFGSSTVTLNTLGLAFQDMGIKVEDLSEYIQNVESVPLVDQIPKYPVPTESHLNFLKPGSREVVTRPVHVHEHLPPMYPEMEEEDSQQTPLSVDTATTSTAGNSPLSSPKGGNVFKRPGEPTSVEHPAVKRARLMLEEEGRPLREISSVMMTTSGFLSPAREGKLPESRTPVLNDTSSYSPASSPSSYPTVPPEVKGEKKPKKVPVKKLGDGLKKLDEKELKKIDSKLKDVVKVEQSTTSDEPKVKKLAGMKEFAKLKALKSGALKMMAQASAGALPSVSGMGKIPKIGAPKIPLIKSSKGNKPNIKIPKSEKPIPPNVPCQQQKIINVIDKVKDFGTVVGKLSSEPDKQKLNIFKKISKVKEDKSESVVRESSPDDMREARMAQIDDCIDSVIQRSLEAEPEVVAVSDSDSRDSTALPKTPDLPSPLRKADLPPEKKRKRERSKSRKEKGRSPKSSPVSSPKKIKLESAEPEVAAIPKFPDPLEMMRPSVFPFFTHFPPAPGLIPPPIGHPLFPRFPLALKNMPHPAMPNLAMPPALFMQHREDLPEAKVAELPPEKPRRPPTPTVLPPRETTPSPQPHPHGKEKVPTEKKIKEHKKDKKEKDKTKKKKDKKERLKAKAEKRKIKEEKKEREKEKLILKKEKKEKRKEKEKEKEKEKVKEKEREEKAEGAVPKITFRLGPSSPRPPTPDVAPRKIPNSKKDGGKESTIKPVVKKTPEPENTELTESSVKREPSPELARISALITRPPKKSSKSSCPEDSHVAQSPLVSGLSKIASPRLHTPPKVGPQLSRATKNNGIGQAAADKEGNKVWICPACGGQDDGSPMIGCDDCDAWYHWVCVGIQVPPDENEDWYCRVCIVKKQENYAEKNKKKRKKKQQSPN